MIVEYIVLAAAILTFSTAVIGYLSLRRGQAAIHVLVNSRLSAVIDRVEQLTQVLEAHGIDIPDDPGKDKDGV